MLNKFYAFLFSLFLSANRTSNDFSATALDRSALAGACLPISSSRAVTSCVGLADSAMFLCAMMKWQVNLKNVFVNAIKMPRSNLQNFAGRIDPDRELVNRCCKTNTAQGMKKHIEGGPNPRKYFLVEVRKDRNICLLVLQLLGFVIFFFKSFLMGSFFFYLVCWLLS